ncbi:uncharacterized protein LOC142180091 [Nicotiana tabacum]|uniref:Uncharacterized protein LOC142180091 n=1 Tax=Nicotiana tabacum TaxID=4097 RepID=A0AC58UCB8_TOBAC
MKLPNPYESISVLNVVDVVEDAIEVKMEEECLGEALEAILMNFDDDDIEGNVETMNALEGFRSYTYKPKKFSLDLENRVTPPAKPSIIDSPQLELKPLPPHLRFKFLCSNDTLPLIISYLLNDVHVEQLFETLKEHKRAIGWTIADIRGIPSGICDHKIQLEEDRKPNVEHQMKLNSSMQEVPNVIWANSFSRMSRTWWKISWRFSWMRSPWVVNHSKIALTIIVISKRPPPTSIKGVRSFLGHTEFYQRFIKDFSKIVSPMCKLPGKDAKFVFNDKCLKAFEELKANLTTGRIIVTPDWSLPFELMCDASGVAIGVVIVNDRKGTENQVVDHRSRLEEAGRPKGDLKINNVFPYEQLLAISSTSTPWYADIANFLISVLIPD